MSRTTIDRKESSTVKLIMIILSALIILTSITLLIISRYINKETTNDNSNDTTLNKTVDSELKETAKTIVFGDIEVIIDEDIPRNLYSHTDFSYNENGLLTYKSTDSVCGIDVSSFQGEIDWDSVKASGVDFAIIRLGYRGMSEGLLYTDDYFYNNIDGAISAGIDVGIYFFSQAITVEESREEAQYVIEVLDDYELQYPVFFDWEPGTDSIDRTNHLYTLSEINSFATEFCNVIRNSGFIPGIYFNSYQGYLQYDFSLFQDTYLWLAEYDALPDFYYYFDIWQYSYTTEISGISVPVDANICFIPDFKN